MAAEPELNSFQHMEAIFDPKTADEFALAVNDPRSPLHKEMIQQTDMGILKHDILLERLCKFWVEKAQAAAVDSANFREMRQREIAKQQELSEQSQQKIHGFPTESPVEQQQDTLRETHDTLVDTLEKLEVNLHLAEAALEELKTAETSHLNKWDTLQEKQTKAAEKALTNADITQSDGSTVALSGAEAAKVAQAGKASARTIAMVAESYVSARGDNFSYGKHMADASDIASMMKSAFALYELETRPFSAKEMIALINKNSVNFNSLGNAYTANRPEKEEYFNTLTSITLERKKQETLTSVLHHEIGETKEKIAELEQKMAWQTPRPRGPGGFNY